MAITKKVNITKPRRSATYQDDGPSGRTYKVAVNTRSTNLTIPYDGYGSATRTIPHEDVQTVIDLLEEAILERAEQTKLEDKEVNE